MRPLITAIGLLLAWEALAWATGVPVYILPPPSTVLTVLVQRADLLAAEAAWTAAEMLLGLALGLVLGGTAGVGTVVFALGIGPLTQFFLPWVAVRAEAPAAARQLTPCAQSD